MPSSTQREREWVTPEFVTAFVALQRAGHAYSVEVWEGQELVGGFYGAIVNGLLTGETMFHKKPNVTKLALYALIERLKRNGIGFLDIQEAETGNTSLAVKWGGREIPRDEFLRRLAYAQAEGRIGHQPTRFEDLRR